MTTEPTDGYKYATKHVEGSQRQADICVMCDTIINLSERIEALEHAVEDFDDMILEERLEEANEDCYLDCEHIQSAYSQGKEDGKAYSDAMLKELLQVAYDRGFNDARKIIRQ